MPDVLKHHVRCIAIAGLLLGLAATHAQRLPIPEPVPSEATPDELRATTTEVRESLCRDVELAAQILTDTGTLQAAIPIVMESTGMQAAEIEELERQTCSGDYGDATLPELRAGNRIAVWLVEIHLAALAEVLPAP